MKGSFLLLAGLLTAQVAMAQQFSALWHPANGPVAAKGGQVLHPDVYKVFSADEQALSAYLQAVPANAGAAKTVDLPAPDGSYQTFLVWQTPVMADALAARYPGIYTFTASAVGNPRVTAKIDYTPFGFHAMVFDGSNTYFVDPLGIAADGHYLSYYKRDYPRPVNNAMSCEVSDPGPAATGERSVYMTEDGLPQLANKVNGTTKRKYRLALACTGEYAVAVAGASPTKAAVLAKMVTSVNRVNGVYEREFSFTMELIANTDDVIYLDSNDPFSNNNGQTMLSENQNNMMMVIGLNNFDIGHVFSTGGGGIATKGSVCQTNSKAQGVTGRPNPIGDAFDIDYVAHEIGHQFGGDHTFNYTVASSCYNNGVAAYAYEPGSGSTIMAYGGICGAAADYVAHSDDYFHTASMEQITTYIAGTGCAATSASPNGNATLSVYTATYNIPYLTPFELTGPVASDATADQISYVWEERDRGDFGKPITTTRLKGPMFRPYPPVAGTTRIFPRIESVLSRTFSSLAEKLPDTARTLAFRFAERDIFQGFGCWNIPVDSIRLNVIYTGTPFSVTTPTGAVAWQASGTQTITWNVGNTTAAPISCANVDIFLSTDGGFTFPYTLVSGTPNDGSEQVTIPNVNTSKMRIKVKGAGNVFFSINNADGTISGGVGVAPVARPEVVVSPVPATHFVNISVKNSQAAFRGSIVNALGQKVWQGNVQESLQIPVSGWAKGVYYLQLNGPSGATGIRKAIVVQ